MSNLEWILIAGLIIVFIVGLRISDALCHIAEMFGAWVIEDIRDTKYWRETGKLCEEGEDEDDHDSEAWKRA